MALSILWSITTVLIICGECSPVKQSNELQSTDCVDTNCQNQNTSTNVESQFPENVTEIVMMNLPSMENSQNEIMTILRNQMRSIDTQAELQTKMLKILTDLTASVSSLVGCQDPITSTPAPTPEPITTTPAPTPEPIVRHVPPRDCGDLQPYWKYISARPFSITPVKDRHFRVACDFETDGGRWTVVQRRFDGSVDFYRGWQDYADGFGDPFGEHWAGLELMNLLTTGSNDTWEVRIELEDFQHKTAYAHNSFFQIGDADDNYQLWLNLPNGFDGTAGDALRRNHASYFSTKDRDNDQLFHDHCAEKRKSGWWFWSCSDCNLNGLYRGPGQESEIGLVWNQWQSPDWQIVKKSEMKIRRVRS